MARIGRWCGALVVESGGGQVLVGQPKEPCAVGELEPPWTQLLDQPVPLSGCYLAVDDAPDLAETLAARLVIARNGSVSERLWRLITHQQSEGEVRAQWLLDVPAHVWEVVRDAVLRCT